MANKDVKALVNQAQEYINSLNLKWTFRSIEYIVNREGYTLNQIRGAVFDVNGTLQHDIERSAKLLLSAGLVNPATVSPDDYRAVKERADEICEEWRDRFGYIGVLQIMLVDIMEQKHFFIGTSDAKLLKHLHEEGTQTDLIKTLMAVTLDSKAHQTDALTS